MDTNKNKNASHLTHEMKKTMEILQKQVWKLIRNQSLRHYRV